MTTHNFSSLVLVTGATGKVGQHLHPPPAGRPGLRALHGARPVPPPRAGRQMTASRLCAVPSSIARRLKPPWMGSPMWCTWRPVKETPDQIMDVAVKGLFWLLETCRTSPTFQQFILIGGDAGVGHFVYPHPIPVTETQKHSAYPGCYALSKVLEEVMLEQYYIQYDLNGCCLRAPWIMEKDDFKYQLSFGEDVFGGPRWRDLVGEQRADEYVRTQTIPVMLDPDGKPVKRNFVHVDDLVSAILLALDHPAARQQTFNICMDEPVDYGEVAAYLAASRGLPSVEIKTPYHSTWLDNTKAKFLLGWRPEYDLKKMIDAAWEYQRAADDPRVVWYPG